MSKHTVAVALSLAALAAAQGSSGLSQECQAGISNLSSNSEASTCLALNQLTNIFLTPENQSVIGSVGNWLTAFCGAPVCSDSTIETVVEAISAACATDISGVGVPGNQTQTIIPYIQQYFGTAKDILCLANTSSDQFCAIELANAAEDDLGQPLTLDNLVSAYGGVLSSGQSPVNTSIACSDCTKGAISILHKDTQLGSLVDVNNIASSTCGDDFASSATTLPANIVIGTGSAVPKGNSDDNKGDGAATLAVAGTLATVAGTLMVFFLA